MFSVDGSCILLFGHPIELIEIAILREKLQRHFFQRLYFYSLFKDKSCLGLGHILWDREGQPVKLWSHNRMLGIVEGYSSLGERRNRGAIIVVFSYWQGWDWHPLWRRMYTQKIGTGKEWVAWQSGELPASRSVQVDADGSQSGEDILDCFI